MLGRLEQGSKAAATWWSWRARSKANEAGPLPSLVVAVEGRPCQAMGGVAFARGRGDQSLLQLIDPLQCWQRLFNAVLARPLDGWPLYRGSGAKIIGGGAP
jgi:hypothetical protein